MQADVAQSSSSSSSDSDMIIAPAKKARMTTKSPGKKQSGLEAGISALKKGFKHTRASEVSLKRNKEGAH